MSAGKSQASFHLIRLRRDTARIDRRAGALAWPADVLPGAVIGNFDGMHLGHASLAALLTSHLSQAAALAGKRPAAIFLTLSPHPRRVIAGVSRGEARRLSAAGDGAWNELTGIREKCRIARDCGLDYACFLRFSAGLKNSSAEEFAAGTLGQTLGLKIAVVGYDWAFGRGRSGSAEQLQQIGGRSGLEVVIAPKFELSGPDGPLRVSSGLLRTALAAGDLDEYHRLAGRPFAVSGRVCHGDHRGSKIGFATANLHLPMQALPPDGVYAGWVYAGNDSAAEMSEKVFPAVLNIGSRPTFGGTGRRVEVHLLDFPAASLYKQRLNLDFVSRIRPEKKFDSVDSLKQQIESDLIRGREILAAVRMPAGRCSK